MAKGWKLSIDDVRDIRQSLLEGSASQDQLAELYRVHQSTISRVVNGVTGDGWCSRPLAITCKRGHQDWQSTPNGRRCRTCQRERDFRRRLTPEERERRTRLVTATHAACRKCGKIMELAQFYCLKDGRPHTYCKKCFIRYIRQWQRSHTDQVSLYRREGHAVRRRLMTGTRVGSVSYRTILQRDGSTCWICQRAIDSVADLDFDHVVPLSRGGAHSESNIRPAHAWCNTWKAAKTENEIIDFLPAIRSGQMVITPYDTKRNGCRKLPMHVDVPWSPKSVPIWLLELLRHQRLSYREVSIATGIPRTTVINRLHRETLVQF